MASEEDSNASGKVIYEEIFEIYEEEEGSSSTVHHTDIIYDHVKLEYEDCIQELTGFNDEEKKKENKKESFFNASEPQKSKIKCNKDFLQLTNKRKNSDSTQGLYKYKKKKDTQESDHIEVNNAIDRKFINENVDLIKKNSLITPALLKKKKNMNHFDDENNHSIEVDQEGNSIILLSDTEYSSDKEDNSIITIDDSSCSNSDEYTENEIDLRMKSPNWDNVFKGDMFLVKDPILGTVLNKGSSIYCLEENYIQAENATSATMAARRLLDGVFTVKALSICSMSGMPPRGKGKSAYTNKSSIKPYLCPKAVNAIIEKTLQLQEMNQWYPKKVARQIRQAMATRINEISTCPSRKQMRWSLEERETALCAFSEYMEELVLPPSRDIKLIKKKYPSLDKRTWPQIKTWLYKQQQKETLRRQQLY